MGHFYFPPPPFQGGKQPHEPRKLAPQLTAVRVDEPPYSHGGRDNWLPSVILANGPYDPRPYTFAGARQPLEGRKLNPEFLNVIQVDNPPFRHFGRTAQSAVTQALVSLYPPPPAFVGGNQPLAQRGLAPDFRAVRVDDPPIPIPETFWATYTHWSWQQFVEAQKRRLLSPGIPGQSVDNPPKVRKVQPVWYSVNYDLPLKGKQLSPAIPGQSVDAPPGLRRQLDYRSADAPVQTARRYLAQEAVGRVPFIGAWLSTVIGSWLPETRPTLPRLLNPSITAVRVDDPPFTQQKVVYRPDDVVGQQPNRLNAAILTGADNPPFGKRQIIYSISDDVAVMVRQLLSPSITGQAEDDPPRWRQLIDIIWGAWQPGPPAPITGQRFIFGQQVDNPPFAQLKFQFHGWRNIDDQLPILLGKLNPAELDNPDVIPPVTPLTPGWIPERREDAERLWRESHEYYRRQDRLAAAERAATKQAEATRSEKKKKALRAAVDASELLPHDIPADDAIRLASLLESAATANRVNISVKQSIAALAYANEIARRIEEQDDEEDTVMLLMS